MKKFLFAWPYDSHKMFPASMTLQVIIGQIERVAKEFGFSFKRKILLDDDLERNLHSSNLKLDKIPNSWLNIRKLIFNLSNWLEQEKLL